MTMKPRERFLTALKGGQPDRVPWGESWVDRELQVRIMGREDFSIFDLLAELGIASTIGRIDPPIFAERAPGSGSTVFFTRGLIQTRDDLSLVKFPASDSRDIYLPLEHLAQQNPGDYAIGARIRLGVHATLLSMGLEALAYALADDPGLVETLFSRYVEWTLPIIRRLPETGVDFIWNGDDVAYTSGPMMSPAVFRRIFMPGLRTLAGAIHATGLPWIYHSDGNLMPLMEDLLSLGMQGMHPFEPGAMNIEECKRLFGKRICLLGNIDLRHTLTCGTVEEVRTEVQQRIKMIGAGGGYIITSANTLPYYCKLENVLAMRDAIREFGGGNGV
jgi:uroporphyrinogen decarboxylase